MPELDQTYAALLDYELNILKSLGENEAVTDLFTHLKSFYCQEEKKAILGASLEASGSIGRWTDKFVAFVVHGEHRVLKDFQY